MAPPTVSTSTPPHASTSKHPIPEASNLSTSTATTSASVQPNGNGNGNGNIAQGAAEGQTNARPKVLFMGPRRSVHVAFLRARELNLRVMGPTGRQGRAGQWIGWRDDPDGLYIATDSAPLETQTYVICSDYIDLIGDFTLLYEPASPSASHSRSSSMGSKAFTPMTKIESPQKHSAETSAAVSSTPFIKERRLPYSKVKLGTGATIAQWGISPNLSLVALVRPHMMDQHSALIDYNVATLRTAVLAIFALQLEHGE
ncbi:hypothetical protein P7C70_g545, partial [Phenoliferia sp. Uapishka_3]